MFSLRTSGKDYQEDINSELNSILNKLDLRFTNDNHYKDFSNSNCYTIDDEGTYEADDTISLERKGNTYIVWVHISCPSLYIKEGSSIENYAKERAISIYLVENTISMFPKNVVNKLLSHKSRKKSLCLSFGAQINSNGETGESYIFPSIITPKYRLNYEEAEELIDYAPNEEKDLYILYKILKLRNNFRINKGSIDSYNNNKLKKVRGKLELYEYNQIQSRLLVSEAMILAGTIAADYANKANLPFIYRSVTRIRNQVDQINNNSKIVKNFLYRKSFSKANISTEAKSHDSLGLELYSQVTSPIRRYSDYINHNQIINHIFKKKFYNLQELKDIIGLINKKVLEATNIMREDRHRNQNKWFLSNKIKYWDIIFLSWLSKSNKIALVYFIDINIEHKINLMSISDLKLGNRLRITINKINELDKNQLIRFHLE